MDDDYEVPQPDPATYHEYFEPVGTYDSIDDVTSAPRDSQYEHVPPGGGAPTTASHVYTPLNSLTTATESTARHNAAPPAYEPGPVSWGSRAWRPPVLDFNKIVYRIALKFFLIK